MAGVPASSPDVSAPTSSAIELAIAEPIEVTGARGTAQVSVNQQEGQGRWLVLQQCCMCAVGRGL